MKKAAVADDAASRADKAAAADNKKVVANANKKAVVRPQVASKAPRGAVPLRPTQGGKGPMSAQRLALLAAARQAKPIDRLSQKNDKVARARRRKHHVLKEIREQQESTTHAIPRAPFQRQVRETTIDVSGKPFRWQESALDALQTASEALLTQLFGEANRQTYAQRQKMLLRRTLIFTIQTARRLGMSCIDSGPLPAEVFDMGGGVKLQQIEGPQQIKAYKQARAAANRKKSKKAQPAPADPEPAAAAEDEQGEFSEAGVDEVELASGVAADGSQ
jgi:histone H3/H4